MKDRRKFKRESLAPFTELVVDGGGTVLSGYPTDMSRGGLALEADQALPVGAVVTVRVHFEPVVEENPSDRDSYPVETIQGVVLRVAPMGKQHKISLEFKGLSETAQPLLWGILKFIDG